MKELENNPQEKDREVTKKGFFARMKERYVVKRYNMEKNNEKIAQLSLKLKDLELQQQVVAALLSANHIHPSVNQYLNLLNNDFLNFANEENALEDEAAAIIELQEIGDALKVVSSFPNFYTKQTIAVAGGFSAGKSEFISSFFEPKSALKLTIGIEPTTAIPTYVLNGKKTNLIGNSSEGGVVDLLKIDSNFQNKLSHNMIKSFGFNLKRIMPYIFLETPLKYDDICFIDTPGYNPSAVSDGHTSEDIRTAEEFVHNSEALLWLIGMDSNGTISRSDLDFLENFMYESDKPLYIILNKADLRPKSQLENIMDEVSMMLEDHDIEICGISAYSSINREEIVYKERSLFDFLNSINRPSDKHKILVERLYAIDQKYQLAILHDIARMKKAASLINGIKLDLLQNGEDDLGAPIYDKVSRLSSMFTIKEKEESLNKLEEVIKKMANTINEVFNQSEPIPRIVYTLDDIAEEKQQTDSLELFNDFINDESLNNEDAEGILDIQNLQNNKIESKAQLSIEPDYYFIEDHAFENVIDNYETVKNNSFYVKGNLPRKKLDNFIKAAYKKCKFKLRHEDILFYFDETVFGAGDAGVVVTKSDVIILVPFVDNQVIKLSDIEDINVGGMLNRELKIKLFNDDELIKVTLTQSNKGAEELATAIEDLLELYSNARTLGHAYTILRS